MKYIIGFFLSFFIFLFQNVMPLHLFLNAFVPLLSTNILSLKKEKTLWIAFLIGLLVDLFASTKVGIWSLNFCICTLILFRLKTHFYKDKFLHIAIFASIFSSLSSILHAFFSFLFDRHIPFSGEWMATDFIIMPIIDGLYTMAWFFLSFWLYDQAKLKLFLLKSKLKLKLRNR